MFQQLHANTAGNAHRRGQPTGKMSAAACVLCAAEFDLRSVVCMILPVCVLAGLLVVLTQRYGADIEKARVAALLHDCTKKLEMEEQLALCRKYGIELDELEQKALKLLHAKTGAAIARDIYGVDDEIYSAIWWHTTGHADMTLLELSAVYAENAAVLHGRITELRRMVRLEPDRETARALQRRVEALLPLWREARSLARITAHYYDREAFRWHI